MDKNNTMPSFRYRARDRQGALVTGTLEAEDRAGLEISLDKMGLIPISIVSGRKSYGPLLKSIFRPHKVSTPEIILFSRQLATLSGAGVPLTRALHSIERQLANPFFAGTVREIREDIEGGGVLSSAIKKHPRVFPELYSSMVEAGEAGGILDDILERLAFMLEKGSENRSKVKSATLYPKIVVFAIVAAVVILMYFVIPRFA
ncbi:MAG: type II secretion system F family protein, partial [Deltaproteobacteria bacterium]